MHVTAIIAAGGRGQRLGAAQPKQLLSIGGRPILERSVTAFLAHPSVDAVIVALPQALVDDPPPYLDLSTVALLGLSMPPSTTRVIGSTDCGLGGRIHPQNRRRRACARIASGCPGVDLGLPARIRHVLNLDDFERALKAPGADSEYAKGIELIYIRFLDTLKKLGLEPIETAGKKFDPNLHEAIARVETDEAEDQTILGEMQRGYLFKGKLLRPAWVRVAVKP